MKSSTKRPVRRQSKDDLRPHYEFDYSKAKPNRFAHVKKDQTVVLLDKDLSKVFKTQDEVNNALRALVNAMPKRRAA
ncbi:MAG TPA: hypothetical protein VG537_09965 [Candidatus Kapabacteria bacterium]|jgi:uncharacterized protein (DUF4415 family)|nr:hypothetical protein [Candidatus Kapabacteria bacterium]